MDYKYNTELFIHNNTIKVIYTFYAPAIRRMVEGH